ncbi:MAG: peptidoglycan-binding domain-containing protein, partial [Acidimicrobiaceae bacterium]|nr:peptidoglycan-binding domain-containing protein [Acidimicrobiaceae bacterium]
MRTHLQGAFLLIVLLLAFWWALRWAGPIFDSALGGEDGAIVARAPSEQDAAAAIQAAADAPLDGNEVAALQAALLQVGYSPGPIDGIMGELTRAAIEEAKQ